MLNTLSGQEFTEWMAYAELEPFGEERADLRMAILAALTANIHRDPDKTGLFSPQDFMPQFGQPEMIETPGLDKETAIAAIEGYMMALVAATGGQDLRSPHP